MSFERWGTLSVKDHNDLNGLVANVILFDRLVVPMFTEAFDRDEAAYWGDHGWNPEDQAKRIEQLGALAVQCDWDTNRRKSYSQRFSLLQQLRAEATLDEKDGEMVTRWLLTQEDQFELPEGVNHADVVIGYSSEADAVADLQCEALGGDVADETELAVLLGHALDIPDLPNPEDSLTAAIELSNDSEYRKMRAALHEFQCACLARGIKPRAIVAELTDRSRELNAFLAKEKIPVRKKSAGVFIKVLAGLFTISPVSGIGALMYLWQVSQDVNVKPAIPRRLEPVAAFHELEERTDIKFK